MDVHFVDSRVNVHNTNGAMHVICHLLTTSTKAVSSERERGERALELGKGDILVSPLHPFLTGSIDCF